MDDVRGGGEAIPPSSRDLSLSAEMILPLAAAAMALVAIFGAGAPEAVTIAASIVGLGPWTLLAGGIRLPLVLFALWTCASGAVTVLVGDNPGGVFPMLIAVVYIAWSTDDWWLIGAVMAAPVLAIVALEVIESPQESGAVYFIGGSAISLLSGRMLRRQDWLMGELRSMQALRVEHAAGEERTRIAREVHDVVAHSLTVVMLHVTGARRAMAVDPDRAGDALERAEKVGRESLDSIRQIVGLLRDGEPPDDAGRDGLRVPQPGLADLDALIDGYRSAGVTVEDSVAIDDADIDPAIQLVAYRVVQESLSNVQQHAPGAPSVVRMWTEIGDSHDTDSHDGGGGVPVTSIVHVHVAVDNDVSPSAGVDAGRGTSQSTSRLGLGVRGMRERVVAAGGSFTAGATGPGGWRVTATLPLRTVPAARPHARQAGDLPSPQSRAPS
ncbi:MAG: histidine kinase [Actinomycetota bacterium]|nr:histidine kinase [Actinomycetota bacterium]